jgi:hypothetical protein
MSCNMSRLKIAAPPWGSVTHVLQRSNIKKSVTYVVLFVNYPQKICKNIHIVTPAEFIKAYTQI